MVKENILNKSRPFYTHTYLLIQSHRHTYTHVSSQHHTTAESANTPEYHINYSNVSTWPQINTQSRPGQRAGSRNSLNLCFISEIITHSRLSETLLKRCTTRSLIPMSFKSPNKHEHTHSLTP